MPRPRLWPLAAGGGCLEDGDSSLRDRPSFVRGAVSRASTASRENVCVVDFEYVRSRGAHGHHLVGSFDAFVGSEREIWVGSDASGLIRSNSGPVAFFTDAGRAQWEAAGSPTLEHGPSIDLFAPGCLGGSRMRRLASRGIPTA